MAVPVHAQAIHRAVQSVIHIIDNSNSRGIVLRQGIRVGRGTLDPLQDSDPSRRNNSFPGYRSRWGSMYRERELTREACNFRLRILLTTTGGVTTVELG